MALENLSTVLVAQWSTEQEGDSDVQKLTISALRTNVIAETIGVRGLMLSVLSTSTQDQWQMMKASICFVLRLLHCSL